MESVSRRGFLASATALTAAGYDRIIGAGDRLRIGVIGCGGMATGHMRTLVKMKDQDNIEVAAVSDVYQRNLERAQTLTGGKPYPDYRALLDDKAIDYVLIATPEHWHYQMTVDA
ncbi:MAG: Gfo/Idh/MocA family protein, partial [Bryobacteraceae bacterium]